MKCRAGQGENGGSHVVVGGGRQVSGQKSRIHDRLTEREERWRRRNREKGENGCTAGDAESRAGVVFDRQRASDRIDGRVTDPSFRHSLLPHVSLTRDTQLFESKDLTADPMSLWCSQVALSKSRSDQ